MSDERRAEIRARRRRGAWVALDAAIFLGGLGVSLRLLGRPSLSMPPLWASLFLAATAIAVLQREMPR